MTYASPTLAALVITFTGALAASAPAAVAGPQGSSTQLGAQAPRSPQARSDSAYTVDPSGLGDFVSLSEAVALAPSGALLLLVPGDHTGATIRSKSLRVEGLGPGSVQVVDPLLIKQVGPKDEVSVGGLIFQEGFTVEDCAGEVSFTGCSAIDDGLNALYPPGLWGNDASDCGIGLSRHRIKTSAAVTLVDCWLVGRQGYQAGCDGKPGEHGLMVEDSRVAIYGGALIGADGGDGIWCHGTWTGAGGDALWASGPGTRVFHRGVVREGGQGGSDNSSGTYDGCDGILARLYQNAVAEEGPSVGAVTFTINPVVHPGDLATYTITAPPGADLFIMLAPTRAWREFVPSEGLLHLDSSLKAVSLGVMSTTGTLTRPFPSPSYAWSAGYGSVELQAYARVNGQDRYSEPRTLQATPVGQ